MVPLRRAAEGRLTGSRNHRIRDSRFGLFELQATVLDHEAMAYPALGLCAVAQRHAVSEEVCGKERIEFNPSGGAQAAEPVPPTS